MDSVAEGWLSDTLLWEIGYKGSLVLPLYSFIKFNCITEETYEFKFLN